VPKLLAKLPGWLFLALVDLPAVNHHIVLVGDVIDFDLTKRKIFEAHLHPPAHIVPLLSYSRPILASDKDQVR